MNHKSCVIVANWRKPGQAFWTGSRWTGEYPDAQVYTSHEAVRCAPWRAGGRVVSVVADYGTADERSV